MPYRRAHGEDPQVPRADRRLVTNRPHALAAGTRHEADLLVDVLPRRPRRASVSMITPSSAPAMEPFETYAYPPAFVRQHVVYESPGGGLTTTDERSNSKNVGTAGTERSAI